MNKKCRPCTQDEYEKIISLLRSGFRHNGTKVSSKERIADALLLEANLGIRIGDVLNLKFSDFIRDGGDYRINIVEQKTGKARKYVVPNEVISYINEYCIRWGILPGQRLFPFRERNVQKYLKMACDLLDLKNISTHTMRKFYSTEAYRKNGNDIRLVQMLLNHSSVVVTQRYIGIDDSAIDEAIRGNVHIV